MIMAQKSSTEYQSNPAKHKKELDTMTSGVYHRKENLFLQQKKPPQLYNISCNRIKDKKTNHLNRYKNIK